MARSKHGLKNKTKKRMDRTGSVKETSGATTLSAPDRRSKPGLWEQTPYPARISDGRAGHNKQRLDRRTTGPTVGTRPCPRHKQCLHALAGPAEGRGSLWTGAIIVSSLVRSARGCFPHGRRHSTSPTGQAVRLSSVRFI